MTDDDGYGKFKIDYKHKKAHRVSWEIFRGPIPEGLNVLHHCDNPPCVNPDHLFLGTDLLNIRDSIYKGRFTSIEGRKLTDEMAGEIRESSDSITESAKAFGVNRDTIRKIRQGKTYKNPLQQPVTIPVGTACNLEH